MPATGVGSDSDAGESDYLEDCTQALHQELEALRAALGDKYVSEVHSLRRMTCRVKKPLFEALVGAWCLLQALVPMHAATVDMACTSSPSGSDMRMISASCGLSCKSSAAPDASLLLLLLWALQSPSQLTACSLYCKAGCKRCMHATR